MKIKGGLSSSTNSVELSISIGGGKSYTRIFEDVVDVAINKFVIVTTTLSQMLLSQSNTGDIRFFIEQIKFFYIERTLSSSRETYLFKTITCGYSTDM